MRRCAAAVGSVVWALVASCAQPTQLLVVIDNTDDPSARYDTIVIDATPPGAMVAPAGRASLAAPALPTSLAVVPIMTNDEAVAVHVSAVAGSNVQEREVATRFRPGRRVVIHVDLSTNCDGVACGTDMTCVAGVCVVIPDLPDAPADGGSDATPTDAGTDARDAPAVCEDSCEGATLLRCDGSSVDCGRIGCHALSGPDRCATFTPSIMAIDGGSFVDGTAMLAVAPNRTITFDTMTGHVSDNTGEVRGPGEGTVGGIAFHVVHQATGPAIGVFVVASFTMDGVAIRTTGGNAFALLASHDISLSAGVLDVSASRATPGPGGYAGAGITTGVTSGQGPGGGSRGANNMNYDGGGGGGGHGTNGGDGGAATTLPAAGGIGGSAYSRGVLEGGSGGANAATGWGTDYAGGGGGAVYLAALGTVTIAGGFVIDAGGAGGGATRFITSGATDPRGTGGHGGGAGGMIVIDASSLLFAPGATVVANGGGGSGGSIDGTNGTAGADGSRTTARADGGAGGVVARTGGRGGAADGPAEAGGSDGDAGGGGGGAVGRIVIATSGTPTLVGAILSPAPTLGALTER